MSCRRDRDTGVALIMVLAILATLMVLAVPFVTISKNENAASVAPYARTQAKSQVDAYLRYARYRLTQGHKSQEALRQGGGAESRATPHFDTADESHVDLDILDDNGQPMQDPMGLPIQHPTNDRGITGDLSVRDEQAYPNLLTSPPFLIAASLGRTWLTQDITNEDTEIEVADGSGFPLENGTLLIEGEVIHYTQRDGSTFLGCSRGSGDGLRARRHRADVWVLDDRARQIAMLPYSSPRSRGEFREPASITYVKEISLLGQHLLTPVEVDQLAREFTIYGSQFASGMFGEKVSVLDHVLPENYDGDGFRIRVAAAEPFPPGMVVRLSDGFQTEYGMVARRRTGESGMVWLFAPTLSSYARGVATLQPLQRHPVNINSASKEVLTRLVFGLQLGRNGRAQGANGRVDEDATEIAVDGLISNRPIRDLQHFREVLGDLSGIAELFFTEIQAATIFRNAIDPEDANLVVGTMPFTFASSDHYTVEAAAVVSDGSGQELARARVRERVHVAPLGIIEDFLDTQDDLDRPFYRGRQGRWTVTHPNPVERWDSPAAVPASRIPRFLWRFGSFGAFVANRTSGEDEREDFSNGVFPSKTDGDVRLLPARMEGRGYVQHFDGPGYLIPDGAIRLEDLDPEGYVLERRPFEFSPRDSQGSIGNSRGRGRGRGRGRRGRSGNGALGGRQDPNPVRFDLWYRTGAQGAGGRQVLLDYAQTGGGEGHIELFIDADGSLVGRVDGRTIDHPTDPIEEVAEVRWRPDGGNSFWRPNTWYHLGFSYRGTKPDDLTLWVDGFKRGISKYQTVLTSGMSDSDTFFNVENAEGWPTHGVCMVGSEVIQFSRSGTSFDVVDFQGNNLWGRGQRGTRILHHDPGSPVTLFGYSTLPRGPDRSAATVIPSGEVRLSDTLGPPTAAIFAGNATVSISVPLGGGVNIPVQVEVHDPTAAGGNSMTLVSDGWGTVDFDCFPASGGYILIVSNPVLVNGSNLNGAPVGGVEMAFYENRVGNVLNGLRSVTTPGNPGLTAWQNQGVQVPIPGQNTMPPFYLNRQVHAVRLLGGGSGPNSIPPVDFLSCVIPISVHVSNTNGLAEPESVPSGSVSAPGGATWDTDPEFVEVGPYDLLDLDNHDVEWIRYHHVDDSGHLLCDEVVFLSTLATYMRAAHLGRQQGILGSTQALEALLPMRRQMGTEQLSDGRPAAGSRAVPGIRTVAHSASINVPGSGAGAPTNGQKWSAAGWGDHVTIEGVNGRSRRSATVSWAALDRRNNSFPGGNQTISTTVSRNYEGQGWISLTENMAGGYRQRPLPNNGQTSDRKRYVRILKFPSGEMPNMSGSRSVAGGTISGQVASGNGRIDEIRIVPFEPERFIVWDHSAMNLSSTNAGGGGITASTDEIPIANVEWLVSNPRNASGNPRFYVLPDGRQIRYDESLRRMNRNDAGVIRIDEELIAYRVSGTGAGGGPALLQCERGVLGTIATTHGWGARVSFLDFKEVSMLNNAMDAQSEQIPVTGARSISATEGTLLIDQELLHYTQRTRGQLLMPFRVDSEGNPQGGLFRGRFGTAAATHDAQSIAYVMPFRYWDRYVPEQDGAELAWYGFSLDLPGAFFHSLDYDVDRPFSHTDVELLIRTDSETSWTAPPGSNGLHLLSQPPPDDEPFFINETGDGLSVRVYFKYLQGAFDPFTMEAHDWKATPVLKWLRVQYLDQTRVLQREVR